MPLQIGQTIHHDRYRIDSLLGQGGMGAVYLAWDTNLEIPVAIKENLDASPKPKNNLPVKPKFWRAWLTPICHA